jgi:6-phosphofructokinase 2
VPIDFYGEVCAAFPGRFVLDTSSEELRGALAVGGLFLLKVSGEEMSREDALGAVQSGKTELVTLTLGRDGALLIAVDGTWSLPSFEVETVSTVGAGDSFLAGMTCGLARGLDRLGAFRLAVAAGAAATLSPGTDLAYAADVDRLLPMVGQPQRVS